MRSGRAAGFAVVPLAFLPVGKVILREIIVVSNIKIRCFLVLIMEAKGTCGWNKNACGKADIKKPPKRVKRRVYYGGARRLEERYFNNMVTTRLEMHG